MQLPHNLYNLRLIEECIALLDTLGHTLQTPFNLTLAESESVFQSLTGQKNTEGSNQALSLVINNKVFLVFDIRTQTSILRHNTEIFWHNTDKSLDAKSFYQLVHPDYLEDFIKIGMSVYNFIHLPEVKGKMKIEPLTQAFELICPFWVDSMQRYMWLKQECRVWQMDTHKNLVSHFNMYSIARAFNNSENLPIQAILWHEDSDNFDWTAHFQKFHVLRQPLTFTRTQARILYCYNNQPNLTSQEIALKLGSTENAVNGHNKEILRRIRESHPAIPFANVKQSAVPFMRKTGFFN